MEHITISSVLGNGQRLDGGAMFGNAPRPLWERWYQPDELGRIELACRSMLIQYAGKNILCEAGIGSFMEPALAERFGVETPDRHTLLENLHNLDVSHEQIDYVVLSHLHFDHAGGILPSYSEIKRGNDSLLFPNARFIIGKEAMDRSESPHLRDRASFIPGLTDKLRATGRLTVVESNSCQEFFPDRAHFFYSDGHTPGQMHLIFRGDKTSVVFAGDLVPGTAWLHLPITMGYDRFPERLIDEKEALYQNIDSKEWLLFYTHDPSIACSKVQRNERGKYVPTEPMEVLSQWKI